jgi:hypothetical protein
LPLKAAQHFSALNKICSINQPFEKVQKKESFAFILL